MILSKSFWNDTDLILAEYYASTISVTGRRAVKIFVLTVEMSLDAAMKTEEKNLDYLMMMMMIKPTLILIIMLKSSASSSESNRQKY